MGECGIRLESGEFILCCSLEVVHLPVNCCGILYSKSSTGRMGLEHMHAGYIDPGFRGQLTFEFHNVAPWPIRLMPGRRVMQMCIDQMIAPAAEDYSRTGRYQGQVGATPAVGWRSNVAVAGGATTAYTVEVKATHTTTLREPAQPQQTPWRPCGVAKATVQGSDMPEFWRLSYF